MQACFVYCWRMNTDKIKKAACGFEVKPLEDEIGWKLIYHVGSQFWLEGEVLGLLDILDLANKMQVLWKSG